MHARDIVHGHLDHVVMLDPEGSEFCVVWSSTPFRCRIVQRTLSQVVVCMFLHPLASKLIDHFPCGSALPSLAGKDG